MGFTPPCLNGSVSTRALPLSTRVCACVRARVCVCVCIYLYTYMYEYVCI